ncbi:MAG: hypothetical protein R3249_01650 [Nitriliruptorales bacterium]|nr:hypothetical protein [Nitriliruptorales bacterium]
MTRRLLAALLAGTVLLAGCGAEPEAVVEDSAIRLARLHDAVAQVAREQAAADELLSELVAAVRDLEQTVVRMRDAETIGSAIAAWPEIDDEWPAAGGPPVRVALRSVAMAVDDARLALASVRGQRSEDWERRYLDAEDEVLGAVRDYAASADRLTQAVEHHWDNLLAVRDLVNDFVERRWFFRNDAEATQAFEVEVRDLIGPLDRAARDILVITREREAAATAVNEATIAARDLWALRPRPSPSP